MNREDVYAEYLMVKESSLLGFAAGRKAVSRGISDFESSSGTKLTDDEKDLIRARSKGGGSGFVEGQIAGGLGAAAGGIAGGMGVGSGLENKIADSLTKTKADRFLRDTGKELDAVSKLQTKNYFKKNLKGIPAIAIGGLLGTGLAGYGTYKRKQREAAREARDIVKNRK